MSYSKILPSAWLHESRAILHLAVPLALTQIAHMAIVTTDVVMMGRIGTDALAAGTLSSHFYWVFVAFAMGTLTGATPIMAQHLGARRFRKIRPVVRNAAWLCLLLAITFGTAAWFSGTILTRLGQEEQIAANGQSYLRHMVWGLLPGLWLVVLSEFLVAHARPRAVLFVTILGIALNALLDYALMFGNLGAPELGLDGAGVASALVNVFMFLALLFYVLRDKRLCRYRLLGRFWKTDWAAMREIARVGLPIAVTEVAEMGMFVTTSLMMGLLGVEALAAHGVTAQCYAVIFMIPVGLAQAGAVRVGRAVGAGETKGAALSGWTAVAMAGIFTLIPVTAFWFAGRFIASLILDASNPGNADTLALASSLLAVASFFMLADSIQITARGALQGMKDTAIPMVIALATSWGLGLPAALILGFELHQGGQGIWAGLAIAMTAASLLLVWRFRNQTRSLVALNGARSM